MKYLVLVTFNVAFTFIGQAQHKTFLKIGAGGGMTFSRISYLKEELDLVDSRFSSIGAIAQYNIGVEVNNEKWTSSIGTYNRIINNSVFTGRRLYNLVVSGGYAIHKSSVSTIFVIGGLGYFYFQNTNNSVPVFYAQSIDPLGLIINTTITTSVKNIVKSSPLNLNFGFRHIRIFDNNAIIITLMYTKSFFYYDFFTYNVKIVKGSGAGKENSVTGKYNGDGLTLTVSYGLNTNQLHKLFNPLKH